MCLECGKHNSKKAWYLDEEKHRLKSLGFARDMIANKLNPLITIGLKFVRLKQPDYINTKMNFVSRTLLSWFAKTLHGMQFLPNIEAVFSTIDMANDLALMPCLCKKAMDPDDPPVYRCIAMNIAVSIYEKEGKNTEIKRISKQQAKDLVVKWRKKGAWQSVGWLWDANVIWVCNCDEYCVAYRAPEATWGGIPSFMITTVGNASACNGCRDCADWCKHRAISHGEDDIVRVDPNLCKGCGLCVENCENQVLVFEPRQTFYDVRTKKINYLGKETVHLD